MFVDLRQKGFLLGRGAPKFGKQMYFTRLFNKSPSFDGIFRRKCQNKHKTPLGPKPTGKGPEGGTAAPLSRLVPFRVPFAQDLRKFRGVFELFSEIHKMYKAPTNGGIKPFVGALLELET
ncbi:MAG TPA: hypothetical protein H9795_01085 [Candidatus Fournierella merdigallinarum]|nr:hypothetical protein [Candidatus Fournierella merdigallinarum]